MTNVLCHLLKHLISKELVLNNRILLCIRLKSDTLTKLIHIINMVHPLTVNNFKKNNTFYFTNTIIKDCCIFFTKFYSFFRYIHLGKFIKVFLFLMVNLHSLILKTGNESFFIILLFFFICKSDWL